MAQELGYQQVKEAFTANSQKPNNFTEDDFSFVKFLYELPHRKYHGYKHAELIGAAVDKKLSAVIDGFYKGERSKQFALNDLKVITGFFHDPIQLQVDGGLYPDYLKMLSNYVHIGGVQTSNGRKPAMSIRKDISRDNIYFEIAMEAFGLDPGDSLVHPDGVNEFLSSIMLAEYLDKVEADLYFAAASFAVIQGTIPFRTQEDFDELEVRLKDMFDGLFSEAEVKSIMVLAVDTANKDICSFYDDFPSFIDAAMDLIPEEKEQLRYIEGINSEAYMEHMAGMRKFYTTMLDPKLEFLDRGNILHQCHGYPSDEDLKTMQDKVDSNLQKGADLFEAKALDAGLMAAISNLIGEPKLLYRDMVEGAKLDLNPKECSDDTDKEVLELLKRGKRENSNEFEAESKFDAYIYAKLGKEKMHQLYQNLDGIDIGDPEGAVEFVKEFKDALGEEAFLEIIDSLQSVARINNENLIRASNVGEVALEAGISKELTA